MTSLFFDTDILLDLLLARAPHHTPAAELLSLVEAGVVRGAMSPLTVANLHYVLRRAMTKAAAIQHVRKLRLIVRVVTLDEQIIDRALSAEEFSDFEDAIQYYSAVVHKMDGLVTRNKRDYRQATIPLYTAEEYLTIHHLKGAPRAGGAS
ncbi:MAG: PIN domain-containing protein [Candidatus Omnitrophica bacterium]|nr:PIN domain-containing protein [Candidatus Omnitrophota bacterium]